METNKRLASIALFRELFESKSNNAYDVLSELILYGMRKSSLHQGSIEIVKGMLSDVFDYSIPTAVIEYTIRKRMKLIATNGIFVFPIEEFSFLVETQIKQNEEQHELILSRLLDYIKGTSEQLLSDTEQERIVHSFCSYILDDSEDSQYSYLINKFIVEHAADQALMQSLNTIKEGVVLYTGLRYTCDTLGQDGWRAPLVFFLDTDVLFSATGYNGPLFQRVFLDFYNLVKEINAKNKQPPIIKLKYFETTKEEVLRFFDTAKSILEGKIPPIPGKTAMLAICNGKSKGYEIREEYAKYLDQITKLGIELDTRSEYYSTEDTPYNIESKELIEYFSQTHEKNVSEHLQKLNFINILRRGDHCKGFERTKYWLLTGNSSVFYMGLDEILRGERGVGLATTLPFFTNKFWFKLNKGFGANNEFPKSFNVISIAQLALISHVNNSLTAHYDGLRKDIKSGELSKEKAACILAELKRYDIASNETESPDIVSALNFVDRFSVEQALAESDQLKQRVEEAETKSKNQDSVIDKHVAKIDQLEKEKADLLQEKSRTEQITEQRQQHTHRRKQRIWFISKIFLVLIIIAIYIYCETYHQEITQTISGWVLPVIAGTAAVLTILSFWSITPKKLLNLCYKERTKRPR